MSTSRHVAIAAVLLLWAASAEAAPAPPDVSCTACAVGDAVGHVYWGRAVDQRLPNASSTKIVTALVVLDRVPLEDEVTVSASAAATPGGYLSLEPGEVLTVEDLLHGLLMASSNDAAVALAQHVSGSEKAFVEEMNETATDLGARGTHFVTPHGLDAPGHVSTARDLAGFAAALLEEPHLARIVAATGYTLSDGETITNSNPLLEGYEGATGVKTGMTAAAGEVLVASATRSGTGIIAVALGSPDAAADAAALLDYGFVLARRTFPAPIADRFARTVVASARELAGEVKGS
jgi:serine-type D-Ala-D-Ala carboxypeptidase (penicillin-binding protein 5/6)